MFEAASWLHDRSGHYDTTVRGLLALPSRIGKLTRVSGHQREQLYSSYHIALHDIRPDPPTDIVLPRLTGPHSGNHPGVQNCGTWIHRYHKFDHLHHPGTGHYHRLRRPDRGGGGRTIKAERRY